MSPTPHTARQPIPVVRTVCTSCGMDCDPADEPAPTRWCATHGINWTAEQAPSIAQVYGDTRPPVYGTQADLERLGLVQS